MRIIRAQNVLQVDSTKSHLNKAKVCIKRTQQGHVSN